MKRLLLAAALAVGLLPALGTSNASANQCASSTQMFFWTGARIPLSAAGQPDRDATQPVNVNWGVVGCTVDEASGVAVAEAFFFVPPGSTFVSGRDNAHVCASWGANQAWIRGLGVDYNGPWTPPVSPVDGSCSATVGTNGARTPNVPMNPTLLGHITAATPLGSVQHHTIDNL